MVADLNGNGGWPELPKEPPTLEELPDDATPIELARAYAQGFVAFAPLWRKSVHALEFLFGLGMGTKAALERLEDTVASLAIPLPTMRPQLGSSHDLAKAVGSEVAERFEREARNPSTPAPDAKKLAELAEEPVAIAIAKIKAEWWDRLEAERKAAETERLATLAAEQKKREELAAAEARRREALELVNTTERVRAKWSARIAVLTAMLGALAWALEHYGHH